MTHRNMIESNEWRVLLIGGNAGAGKTHLAKGLVGRLGIPFLMVDDIRIALQAVTSQKQQPDLHIFLNYQPEQWMQPETIVVDWIRVGKAMIKPLREIVSHHLIVDGSGKLILEGDGILPALARQSTFNEIPGFETIDIQRKVKAIFLIEEDDGKILGNLRRRGRGMDSGSLAEQEAFAKASKRYAEWLVQEACSSHIPVIATRRKETTLERVLEKIR